MSEIIRHRYNRTTLRGAVLKKLGDKCVKCGFTDVRALQIDHVYGGGVREWRNSGYYTVYNKVLEDTEGRYQLLCANCNWIKRYENNEVRGRKE